jgi:hypothetical protein
LPVSASLTKWSAGPRGVAQLTSPGLRHWRYNTLHPSSVSVSPLALG